MNKIKSLRTIKFILPVVMVFFAALIFFAFANSSTKMEKNMHNKLEYTWIRFDCSPEPMVLIVENGTNYQENENLEPTGNFSNCTGFNTVCAIKFLTSEVEDVPGHPGNKQPKPGVSISGKDAEYCN